MKIEENREHRHDMNLKLALSQRAYRSSAVCLCGDSLLQQNAEEQLEESQALSKLEEVCWKV